MADVIGATYSTLTEKAGQVTNIISDFETVRSKLDAVVLSLGETWKGDAQTAFENRYQTEFKPALQSLLNELQRYSEDIIASANEFQAADQAMAQRTSR